MTVAQPFSFSWLRVPANLKRLWPLLLPLLLLIPGSSGFPYSSDQAIYSDLAISHYPNALFLKQTLLESGRLPLWSPAILSGFPFAANPLSGLWYPPGWLALVFPLPLGLNLLAILHLLWGGVGLYGLLRQEGLAHRPALLAALGFEMLPKLFAHYGAGHLTLLYAVPWTPWLLYFARANRSLDAGLVLGGIFLADPRWAPYAGLLWLADRLVGNPGPGKHWRRVARQMLTTLGLAFLLAAPLALPLLEYTRLSTRAELSAIEAAVNSLPPIRLLGIFLPVFSLQHEWVLYPGGVVLGLAGLVLLDAALRRRARFWVWVAGLTLAFSLGSYLPGLPFLAHGLGLGLLRVPPRALFLCGMAFAVLAAHALQALLVGPAAELPLRRFRLGLGVLNVVVVLPAALMALVGRDSFLANTPNPGLLWGGLALLPASILIALLSTRRASQNLLFGLLVAVAWLDWAVVDAALFEFQPAEIVLAEQQAVIARLKLQPGIWRTYSPSYSLPQQVGALANLELADGVDPLQLQAYTDWMARATGVPQDAYSVTLPPFASGDPRRDNQDYLPDPQILGILNVAYLLAEYPLAQPGLEFRGQFGETWLYENRQVLPRAWVQPSGTDLGQDWVPVGTLDWSPNQIVIQAAGPGMLVLSEMAYPGWVVEVDGQPVAASQVDIFRAVWLEAGEHRVVFDFRPLSVLLGVALGAIGLLGWIGVHLRIKRRG